MLQKLRAPLGVWAVTGNHEYYAGLERSVGLLEAAGYTVLRDRAAEIAPGLVLAGVDDLGARRQFGRTDQADKAAAGGAGLMLSGHTHNGQIWPFNYLVRLSNPLVGGRYEIGGMPVIVGRGTGTWGPRMRLWRPSEIVRITLRAG